MGTGWVRSAKPTRWSVKGVLLAAGAAVVIYVLLGLLKGRAGAANLPRTIGWNPMMLHIEDRRWVHDWVRTEVPSMVWDSRRQLSLELAAGVLLAGIPGDFVETGVAAGGTAIMLCKALEKYDADGKRVLWAADSFEGLPDPSKEDAAKKGGQTGERGKFSYAEQVFRDNLAKFKVPESRVRVLKGWFNETLPAAPIQRIAYLRLDGDLYVSTHDPLEALYDRLSVGGIVYVDDYGGWPGCRKAVMEFRAKRGIKAPLQTQYWPDWGMERPSKENTWDAVWWVKEE